MSNILHKKKIEHKMDKEHESAQEQVNGTIITVIFSVMIIVLSLAWNLWFYHVFFHAVGCKNVKTRTLF